MASSSSDDMIWQKAEAERGVCLCLPTSDGARASVLQLSCSFFPNDIIILIILLLLGGTTMIADDEDDSASSSSFSSARVLLALYRLYIISTRVHICAAVIDCCWAAPVARIIIISVT